MATEYELKFNATPDILAEIDRAFSGESVRIFMETTYYDTPTGALSSRKFTLRKRLENGVPVCTLKAPAGDARGEWETECENIQTAIPMLLTQGCPEELTELVKEGLVSICGAKFTRIAKTISLPNGSVELALDQGVLFGDGRETPLCEVEAELKSGEKAVCDHFARELALQFQLTEEKRSKFSRALALYKGE